MASMASMAPKEGHPIGRYQQDTVLSTGRYQSRHWCFKPLLCCPVYLCVSEAVQSNVGRDCGESMSHAESYLTWWGLWMIYIRKWWLEILEPCRICRNPSTGGGATSQASSAGLGENFRTDVAAASLWALATSSATLHLVFIWYSFGRARNCHENKDHLYILLFQMDEEPLDSMKSMKSTWLAQNLCSPPVLCRDVSCVRYWKKNGSQSVPFVDAWGTPHAVQSR